MRLDNWQHTRVVHKVVYHMYIIWGSKKLKVRSSTIQRKSNANELRNYELLNSKKEKKEIIW